MARLFLVHFDGEEAAAWADEFSELGWEVGVESEADGSAYRHIRDDVPDVVVVFLRDKSDWGVRAAEAVRHTRWGHEVPFIFVGGTDDDALLTLREDFPEASYVEAEELPAALAGYRGDHA